jgi:predicted dehydrogenase
MPLNVSPSRRRFLQSSAVAGAGLLILPSGMLRGAKAPSNKLNIALIGVGGRGLAHYDVLKEENVVALCDVNELALADAAKVFPNAKHYIDWRQCLEQKDLDAVVICSLDHTHAFISLEAMRRDLHVYCEKPLANSVEEARLVREAYLKKRKTLATQCGTQRHAFENFPRLREMIQDGAIGELKEARAWGDRQLHKKGYLPAEGTPPSTLHYDLWLGPSHYHPYNPEYFSGKPGMNCLNWNMYWDFGTGQMGDMGSHTMDLVWNVIDATWPTSAEATGDPYHPEVSPVTLTATWEHPANAWRPGIRVMWHQGASIPTSPQRFIDLAKIGHGALFKGDKGFVIADFQNRILLPYGQGSDLTYYRPRKKEKVQPAIGHFQKEWVNACKGSLKTSCDFDYSGLLIEQQMLGLVAHRAGARIEYDGKAGKVTNRPEANAFLKKTYREGWKLGA